MNGKGDSPRPVDKDRYDSNYDEIEWNVRSKSDCKGCQVRCKHVERTGVVCFPEPSEQKPKQIHIRKEGRQSLKDPGK